MIPALIVLGGYLAADIFMHGLAAAIFVISLGFGEFLFLRIVRKRNHPSLILEAVILSAAGMAGEMLSRLGYQGGGYIILEIVLAGILLLSTAAGKPWLASQMRRFAGFSAGDAATREISIWMGFLFLVHGVILSTMLLAGLPVRFLPSVASFVVLYLGVILILRSRLKRQSLLSVPVLRYEPDGRCSLEISGEVICTLNVDPGVITDVSELHISGDQQLHKCLETLEGYFRGKGCRGVRFIEWKGDSLPLEMAGYKKTPVGWNKIL